MHVHNLQKAAGQVHSFNALCISVRLVSVSMMKTEDVEASSVKELKILKTGPFSKMHDLAI